MNIKDVLTLYKLRSYIMKLIKSTTTQNVALGAGTVVGIIAIVRNFLPQLVFWPESADNEIENIVLVLAIPLVSRLIALFRDPSKAK